MALQDRPIFPETRHPLRASILHQERSVATAVFLSMVFPGLGQMHIMGMGRGIAVMIGFVFGMFLFLTPPLSKYFLPAIFLMWLLNIYDAYHSTHEFNKNLQKEWDEANFIQEKNAPHLNPLYANRGAGIPVSPESENRYVTPQFHEPTVMAQTPLPLQPARQQNRFCSQCGKQVEQSTGKFCQYCGNPLT